MATLNASVPELRGEIVVFSDAAAMLDPSSVRRLVENFADPAVGAVSGLYKVVKTGQVNIGTSEDFYWKYETFLKVQESQLGSTLGGHGHLHAIRKALYPYPPPGTINDDYVIPVSVLAKGYRAVYEPSAIVYEEAHEMAGFGRRVRIMAGNIQQLREIKGLLNPLLPLTLFFFLSHKAGRLVVPFAMLAALAANLLLLSSPIYLAIFCAQLVFYLLAALGGVWRLRPKTLMLPFYFCMINAGHVLRLLSRADRSPQSGLEVESGTILKVSKVSRRSGTCATLAWKLICSCGAGPRPANLSNFLA